MSEWDSQFIEVMGPNTIQQNQHKGRDSLSFNNKTCLCGVPQVDRGTLCGTLGLRMRANRNPDSRDSRVHIFPSSKTTLASIYFCEVDGTKFDRAVISSRHLSAWTMIVLIKFLMLWFGVRKGIPTHQSMPYLKFVCKSCKG